MSSISRSLLFAFAAAGILNAGTITTGPDINGTTVNAADLTGFDTSGADMAGMVVTVNFGGGAVSCVWETTGVLTGGCVGSVVGVGSFSVSESGDTYTLGSNWTLTNTTPVGAAPIPLLSILFDGLSGLTVFDRAFGGVFGTDGSALGRDASGSTPAGQPNGAATYIDRVGTLGNAPVGDLFARLRIDFGNGLLPTGSAIWISDTDSIGVRGGVPEPGTWGTLVLGGCALIAAGRLGRRRKLSPLA